MRSADGRYVISLVNIRQIHEFVMHRRQGDVLKSIRETGVTNLSLLPCGPVPPSRVWLVLARL